METHAPIIALGSTWDQLAVMDGSPTSPPPDASTETSSRRSDGPLPAPAPRRWLAFKKRDIESGPPAPAEPRPQNAEIMSASDDAAPQRESDDASLLHRMLRAPVTMFEVTKRQTEKFVSFSVAITKRHMELRNDLEAYSRMRRISEAQVFATICAITFLIVLQSGQYDENMSPAGQMIMKAVLLCITVAQIVMVHGHYRARVAIISQSGLLPRNASLYRANLLQWFTLEFALVIIHPTPFLTFGNLRDEQIIGLVIFLRAYLLSRFLFLHSYFSSSVGRFVSGFTKITFTPNLMYRVILSERPYPLVIGSFVGVLFSIGYCLLVVERFDNPLIQTYSDALWLVVVTILTIGYGDKYPVTIVGRAVVVSGAFAGIILTAMIITLLFKALELSPQESKLVSFLRRDSAHSQMIRLAAQSVQAAYRLKKLRSGEATTLAFGRMMDKVMAPVVGTVNIVMKKQNQKLMIAEQQRRLYQTLSFFRKVRRSCLAEEVADSLDPSHALEEVQREVTSAFHVVQQENERIAAIEIKLAEIANLLVAAMGPQTRDRQSSFSVPHAQRSEAGADGVEEDSRPRMDFV